MNTENDSFDLEISSMVQEFIEYYLNGAQTKANLSLFPSNLIRHMAVRVNPGGKFDRVLSRFIHNYENGMISLILVWDPYKNEVTDTWFEYQDESINAMIDGGPVDDDTELPSVLDIIRACVAQNTANPVVSLPNL